jgi:predicted  nucleic acid-binding Zn-ribbon protein
VYVFAADRITAAEDDRRNARDQANRLDADLRNAQREIESLKAGLVEAQKTATEAVAECRSLRQAIQDGRQVTAHGKAEVMARFRSVLASRIDPLLSDSADALDIDPPIVEVAKDRIESARAVTKGEIEWLDGSSG